MERFAGDVSGPLLSQAGLEWAKQGANLIILAIVFFCLLMAALTVVLLLLRKKFIKVKDKNYLNLP